MALSTTSLARASALHPWRTIGLWAVALVVSFAAIGMFLSDALTTEQSASSNPDSIRGQELLEERLTGPMKVEEAIIVRSESSTVDDAAFKSYVAGLESKLSAMGPGVIEQITSFASSGNAALVSEDRRTTILPYTMAGDVDTAADNIVKILDTIHEDKPAGFEVYSAGNASIGHDFNKAAEEDLKRSESYPLVIALVVLILVFGAVVAALLPIVLALFAIVAAVALTAIIGQAFQFSFFVTNMIVMMGLAVGIDYCLFIISRYREELGRGIETIEAITVAAGTAGRAVLFSGITVVVALAGMLIVPTSIFRSLAGGAILVVLVAVLASLTLLPAILRLLGGWVNRLRIPFIQHAQEEHDEQAPGGFWDRIARLTMNHPVISLVLGTGLLLAACIPFFSINLGTNGVSTLPDSFEAKKGFLILRDEFGGGQVAPAQIVIDGDVNSSAVQGAISRLKTLVAEDTVFGASTFQANQAGDLGELQFQMAADPSKDEALDAISRLRDNYIPEAFGGVDAGVYVTGQAAGNLDFFALTDQYTPIVFVFVLGLSFLLLMMVFRSIVVPAKAIVMNLLSVGAAYGMIVLVSQQGFANEILGFQKVEAIEAWLPLFLFSVLFGLSMDYHVFLLSRVKERYDLTGNNTDAVAFGVRSTGRLITGAALIMVTVFGGFAMGDLVMFQQMGFGLGFAVLVDATIIRSVLVPASMRLLGRWNWYLPPVLSWLPRIGIEGDAVHRVPSAGVGD